MLKKTAEFRAERNSLKKEQPRRRTALVTNKLPGARRDDIP
jgi:hypothetical protein